MHKLNALYKGNTYFLLGNCHNKIKLQNRKATKMKLLYKITKVVYTQQK